MHCGSGRILIELEHIHVFLVLKLRHELKKNKVFVVKCYLERGVRDHAERALGAEHEVVYVRSVADAWHLAVLPDRALGRHDGQVNEQVFDIAVLVLFHAGGARRHPAAECAELHRVGLVASAVALLAQLTLELLAVDAALNARREVLLVYPQYFVLFEISETK